VIGFALVATAGAGTTFADPTGDTTGPDVTNVSVRNDGRELIAVVHFANRPSLAAGDVVLVDFDADANAATGEDGVDVYAAFDGGDEPTAFEWRDGAFVQSSDVKATFAAGDATVVVQKALVGAAVGVAVTAVAGQDPGVDPTDRAPDSGRWTYTVSTPRLQKVAVKLAPAQPIAGKRVSVRSVALTLTQVGTVAPEDLTCDATLAAKPLGEVDQCLWKLPKAGKGKTLAIRIEAEYGGVSYRLPTQRVKVR
jgi:hypothetical protein